MRSPVTACCRKVSEMGGRKAEKNQSARVQRLTTTHTHTIRSPNTSSGPVESPMFLHLQHPGKREAFANFEGAGRLLLSPRASELRRHCSTSPGTKSVQSRN